MTSSPQLPDAEPRPVETRGLWGAWNRRSVGMLMALMLVGYPMDLLLMGRADVRPLGLRFLWCLSLLLFRIRASPAWTRRLRHLAIALSCSSFLGVVYLVGGVASPYFALVPIFPVAVAISLLSERDRTDVFVCGTVCSIGTCLLLWTGQRSPIESVAWLMSVTVTTLLADFLSRQTLRAMTTEHDVRLERARSESMQALALSEHRRAQSERLATVGRLASGVAHEINNPLAYVGSNVDFVHDELRAPQQVDREALAEVLAETRVGLQHIRQIVADLRGFARIDELEPTACALGDVVADAMKLGSLRLKHVTWLRVDVPVDLPEIFVVRQRLVQVLLNLLVNAGDALEEHPGSAAELRLTGRSERGRVVLLVEDNGPGFAPHVLPRLFEAFVTTKSVDKGTGLGLNLSRELVNQFGGTLTASNRPEGGARLRLELPVHPSGSSASPALPS